MAYLLSDYFKKLGLRVIEGSLQRVVGKPVSYVKDEAAYRMHVIQPGWRALPLGIRLMMKRHVRTWDELYDALLHQVLDLRGPEIALQPDASVRIARLVQSKFGSEPGSSISAAGPGKSTPLAAPVAQTEETAVPLAMPVATKTETPASADTGGVVGIDLGTTFSVIAQVDSRGRPVSLLNQDGERLTPSVVQFGDDGALVGRVGAVRRAGDADVLSASDAVS